MSSTETLNTDSLDKEEEKESTTHHRHPKFIDQANRWKSFDNWPRTSKKTPDQLINAGFFYRGDRESITCFSCGVNIYRQWRKRDDPWKIHTLAVRRFNCDYVEMVKGSTFMESVEDAYFDRLAYIEWKQNEKMKKKMKKSVEEEDSD